jgi:hypothetical protein
MAEVAAEAETLLVLEDFLPYRLAVLAHKTSRELSGVYGERFGLSIAEWRILANLGRFGRLYAGELAERSSMDKPKVTRALQRLEAGGIVQRAVDAEGSPPGATGPDPARTRHVPRDRRPGARLGAAVPQPPQ